MKSFLHLIAFVICVINISSEHLKTYSNSTLEDLEYTQSSSKALSRRKRYLTFPDGSSFQLVFCAQNQGYLQVGDIVWFGNTAALAWELPSDPKYFSFFKEHEKVYGDIANRRQDEKHIYFLDEDGKVIGKKPYKRRPIVNPAFAKRSVDMKINRITAKEMHDIQRENNFLENIPLEAIEFHREGRIDLYEKLETFFNALGWNGEECILRFLCETNKGTSKQGNFLEEIFRATFTYRFLDNDPYSLERYAQKNYRSGICVGWFEGLPRGSEFEKHKYDDAHGSRGDCASIFPNCQDVHGLQLYEQ